MGEQLLLLPNEAMIALLSLLAEVEVLFHFLGRGEGNTVDSLQTVIGGFTEPVRARVLHNLEALDQLAGRDVGASAQINKVTALVNSDRLSILNFTVDSGQLERVCLEHFKGLVFRDDKAKELLI